MSNSGNSSSNKGIKNIINEILKNENPAENEIGDVTIHESIKEIQAPSSLNDNNQGNNQEVHNQDQEQDLTIIQNNNIENNGNHNNGNQSISVDYGEKIDDMNKKMDKMGIDISDIKTGINSMNENMGKGFNNLAVAVYFIAAMFLLLISIIIYQIKKNN